MGELEDKELTDAKSAVEPYNTQRIGSAGEFAGPSVFLEIIAKPVDTIRRLSVERRDKITIIAHTLSNALILNLVVCFAAFGFNPFTALIFLILFVLTAMAIPLIEAATYFAAVRTGGKGDFWVQLNITNIYLTPVFLFFTAMFLITLFLNCGVRFGSDAVCGVLIAYLNYIKLKELHKIEKPVLPSIVYIIGTVAAYLVWGVVLIFSAVIMAIISIFIR